MLLKFTIENFEVFQKPVELSMEANLHTRKFLSNVIQSSQGNALKALAIYGPNNTGKTCTSGSTVLMSVFLPKTDSTMHGSHAANKSV